MDEFAYELHEIADELLDECTELALHINCVEELLALEGEPADEE